MVRCGRKTLKMMGRGSASDAAGPGEGRGFAPSLCGLCRRNHWPV